MRNHALPLLVLGVVVLTGGCGDKSLAPETDNPVVTNVEVEPDSVVITAIPDTAALNASVHDQDGQSMTGVAVVWRSLDEAVVTVDDAGEVVARAQGEARIVAEAEGVADTARVWVEQAVDSIAAHGDGQTAVAGEPLDDSVGVRLLDRLGTPIADRMVHFEVTEGGGSVSDEDVTTDTAGYAWTRWTLGTDAGPQNLRARVDSISHADIPATATPGPPSSVAFDPDSIRFTALGDTARLQARVEDAYGNTISDPRIAWRSLDTVVARVDTTGLVRPVSNGVAGVVASAGEAADTATIVARLAVASIDVVPDSVVVPATERVVFTAVVLDAQGDTLPGSDYEFEWTRLGSLGCSPCGTEYRDTVWGTSEGVHSVVARVRSVADTAVLVATEAPIRSLDFTSDLERAVLSDPVEFELAVTTVTGETSQDHPRVEWSSSDTAVVVIERPAVGRAVGVGAAYVVASGDGKVDSVRVEVEVGVPNNREVVASRFHARAQGTVARGGARAGGSTRLVGGGTHPTLSGRKVAHAFRRPLQAARGWTGHDHGRSDRYPICAWCAWRETGRALCTG